MAKKFSFRLEPVLKLRAFRVQEAKEALSLIIGLRVKKENEIIEKDDYLNELYTKKAESAPVMEMQALWHHKVYVKEQIEKLEKEKLRLIEIETKKRQELADKMRDEKVMLKLKDKQKDAYNAELLSEENKELNEIATNRHYKRQIEEI